MFLEDSPETRVWGTLGTGRPGRAWGQGSPQPSKERLGRGPGLGSAVPGGPAQRGAGVGWGGGASAALGAGGGPGGGRGRRWGPSRGREQGVPGRG